MKQKAELDLSEFKVKRSDSLNNSIVRYLKRSYSEIFHAKIIVLSDIGDPLSAVRAKKFSRVRIGKQSVRPKCPTKPTTLDR